MVCMYFTTGDHALRQTDAYWAVILYVYYHLKVSHCCCCNEQSWKCMDFVDSSKMCGTKGLSHCLAHKTIMAEVCNKAGDLKQGSPYCNLGGWAANSLTWIALDNLLPEPLKFLPLFLHFLNFNRRLVIVIVQGQAAARQSHQTHEPQPHLACSHCSHQQ